MLLALAASPEEVEVLLISVTYGNVDVQKSVLLPKSVSGALRTNISPQLPSQCGCSLPHHQQRAKMAKATRSARRL